MKKKKTVWLPERVIALAERTKGSPGNPLNWAAYLLWLVVCDLSKSLGRGHKDLSGLIDEPPKK